MRSNLVGVLLVLLHGCAGELDELEPPADELAALAASPARLVRDGSGKCLDVDAAGTAAGTRLQQWTCNGTGAQVFTLEDRGDGVVRVKNDASGKCLEARSGATGNGTQIQLGNCSSNNRQAWRVDDAGGGFSRLQNTRSGRCLDVNAASSADAAKVQLWDCNGTPAQRWRIESIGTAPPPPGGLVWRQANLTHFTSWPEPGSDECENFNGCTWAGYFAFVSGQKDENWVMQHNIAAVHSKDAPTYKLKTLRLRQGGREIDVTVYDMCSDSDCSGCCTQNAGSLGFLIDIEKYTKERFGSGAGVVDWACLDCN